MKCTVGKVYAPNGEPSILFKELQDLYKSDEKALEVWARTRTEVFSKFFGDWRDSEETKKLENKLDENGEPLIDYVINPETKEMERLYKESENIAAEYTNSVAKLVSDMSKVRDILTRRLAELEGMESDSSKQMVERIKELKKKLKKADWRQSVLEFSGTAFSNVVFAQRIINKELASDSPNYKTLYKYYKYLTAYDLIDEIHDQIMANDELAETFDYKELDKLRKIMTIKNKTKKKYTNSMLDKAAERLSSLSHDVSKKQMKEYLEKAPFDISFRERMAHFAGDSKDATVALVAKLINEQQQKTRRADIERTRLIAEKLEAMEKDRPSDSGNAEKLYGPMIARDEKGNLLNEIITKDKHPEQYEKFLSKYRGTSTFEFYEFFLEEYDKLNKMLPAYAHMGNRLPTVMKSMFESLVTNENKLDNLKDGLSKKISASNMDMETGQRLDDTNQVIDSIPIYFTQEYDYQTYKKTKDGLMKEVENITEEEAHDLAVKYAKSQLPKYISYDLASSLQVFGHMAENYGNMNDIIDILDTVKDAAMTRNVISTTAKGEPIISKMKDMLGESLIDNKAQISGAESNSYKMLEALLKMQVYGQGQQDLGSIYIGNLNIDTRKLLQQISHYNSVRLMGLNFLAGSANIMMGETMQWADAFGREYYTPKTYMKASAEYTTSLPKIFGDIAERTPKSKIGLFNEYYDILGDYRPEGVRASDSSKLKRIAKSGSLYFINSAGEHMMQTRAAMAVFMSTETFDANGNKLGNLWEAHKEDNGKLSIDDVYVKDSNGDLVKYDTKQRDSMSRKTQALLRRMHGNYNSETKAAWQRNALLGLVGQFRKWIAEGWRRRYAKAYSNQFAEQTLEGNYVTTAKFIGSLIKDLKNFSYYVGKEFGGLNKHERANVIRTLTEVGIMTVLAISAAAAQGLLKDLDDEKDKDLSRSLRYSLYLSNRVMKEITFFVNPFDAWDILRSPMAAMSSAQAIATTLFYGLPWNWDERYEAGVNKGENKFWTSFQKTVPVVHQLNRLTDDGMKATLQYFNLN